MVDVAGSIGGVLSPVLEVGKWLAVPIWRQFKYLYNYSTNFKNLEKKVKEMTNTRGEVQRKVADAERNVEEIKPKVKSWLEDVEKTIEEAEQLIQEKANNPRRFKGLWSKYKQSKKAFKLIRDDIDPLLQKEEKEEKFDKISFATIPEDIQLVPSEDYLVLESRTSIMKNVWDALKDENVYMIGVYGMAGTGKTTLVQKVGGEAKKDELFEDVVFVEVTQNLDIKRVQTEIADKLGVKFSNENEREDKLYKRLRSGDKILLILDNIWKYVDLKTICIPSKADRGGCKLMFTARDLDVLEKMGSINNFKMGILAEKEAWDLFANMAGDVVQTNELNSLANDVCKQCKGLPVVICAIAKALKTETRPSKWKAALTELRAPSPSKFGGLLEEEYMKIALSYKYLRNNELKKTFLICSLMENYASISDLFIHVVCLDILEGPNLTMEDARDRLDNLVHELKDASLLLGEVTSKYFAMHDVIRDVAITIAYVDHHVFTTKNDIERDWKNRDKLKKSTKISLLGNSTIISQLWPDDLDCPALEYFYMPNSHFNIPEDFFKVMPMLKVLNLAGLHQLSLPSSLHLLKNLQTLCLNDSTIKDVAIIGKLKKLKVLSLQHSFIKELPTEIGQLTELRLLNLSNCRKLQFIMPNVISKLLQLEEFHIKGCPIQWKVEVFMELKSLKNLTSVELDVRDCKVLPQNLFAKEPRRYKISIGDCLNQFQEYGKHERMLEVKINSIRLLEELHGFKNVEDLRLADFSEDENYVEDSKFDLQSNEIMPLFNEKVNFTKFRTLVLYNISLGRIWDSQISTFSQNLKQLTLERCGKMTYVFPFSITKSLRQLQSLEIIDCEILEKIVEEEEGAEVVVNSIFPQVTELVLINLPKLTILYPGIHASKFSMFKRLEIANCKNLTSRYLGLQDDNKKGALPISENKINHNLEDFEWTKGARNITWQGLDKSLTIWNDDSAYIPLGLLQRFQSVKKLTLSYCEYKEIKSVSNLPNLEDLCVWDCTELMSLVPSSASLQNLKVLDVANANALLTLTTPSIARSLMQLRELRISRCEMLLEIIENEGDTTRSSEIVFHNLKLLSLTELERLECFCSGNYSFNFSSLEELIIDECPNLKTFSRAMLNTPKLYSVNYKEIGNEGNDLNKIVRGLCKNKDEEIFVGFKYKAFQDYNSTVICYDQHPTSFYQNLTHLMLLNCGNIKYAFPPTIARSLHQLQQLKIGDCMALEEIVAKEGADAVVNFVFPNVTILKLENLPNLTTFYPEIHTLELPKLKELVVRNCDKCLSFKSSIEESEIDSLDLKAISLDDKINSHLEVFELQNASAEITWQKQSKSLFISWDKSTYIPLGLLQRFHNLKRLLLNNCNYKEIKRPLLSTPFQNLKVLKVEHCHGFFNLMTPSMARNLVQLRELSISSCSKLLEIVENERDATSSSEQVVFNNLNKLSLKNLKFLSFFSSGNYSFSFPSLEELIISECSNMKSFCQGMLSTPMLYKINYEGEEIENEGNDLNSTIQQVQKEKINFHLEVFELQNASAEITWQKQSKSLFISWDKSTYIPLGLLQRFHNLKRLLLNNCNYKEIKRPLLSTPFQNLKVLKVEHCHGFFNLMTPSMARNLVQLRELSISSCSKLLEIVENERDATLSSEQVVFNNLNKLSLKNLKFLSFFSSGNYSFSFPSLEELIISECSNMKSFCQGMLSTPMLDKINYEGEEIENEGNDLNSTIQQVQKEKTFSQGMLSTPKLHKVNYEAMEIENEGNDLNKIIHGLCKKKDEEISLNFKCKAFQDDNSTQICYEQHPTSFYQNLTHLILWNCGNIKYAFPPSIAKTLHQLQQLKIGDCKALEQIVAKEEGPNVVVNFVFPNVTLLKLENLPKLIAFYPEIHTSEWPKLKELVVRNCAKYLSFKNNTEGSEINILDPKSIFLDNKINSHLEVFELWNDLAEMCWQNQSKTLQFYRDESAYIPLGPLMRFYNLKELKLYLCNYKEIQSLSHLPSLQVLNVLECQNLLSLLPSTYSFQNLKVLKVQSCNGLVNLATPSVARNLVQLRELIISDCEMLSEVVENKGDAESSSEQVVFNNLNKLSLEYLGCLLCFCSGNYSFNFPSLEELSIERCPHMKSFSQGMINTPKLHKVNFERLEVENGGNDLNTTIQQAHREKVFSNLKRLSLSGRDIMAIWQGQLHENFDIVKTLDLIEDEYAYIPIQILHKFICLENLILKMSSYEELFSFGEIGEHIGVFTNLKQLNLWGLFNLKCISRQDSRLNSILQNLLSLNVKYCHSLTTLLLSSPSFENLRTLSISHCNGMQNLMASSTAKSLVCLQSLSIKECKMMTEVLANEGDIGKGEIVFEKLQNLTLYGLESLTYFYSGNHTLKFPFLERLSVGRCSKTKTLARGGLRMPRSCKVIGNIPMVANCEVIWMVIRKLR